jgi:hypothetical protein
MITGDMPFKPRKESDTVLQVIKDAPISLTHPSFEDLRLTDVIKAMMHLDPARRLTAKEVLDFGWVSGKPGGRNGIAGDEPTPSGLLDMMLQFALEEAEEARATAAEAAKLDAPNTGEMADSSEGPAGDSGVADVTPLFEPKSSHDGKHGGGGKGAAVTRKTAACVATRHVSKVDITMGQSKRGGGGGSRPIERSTNSAAMFEAKRETTSRRFGPVQTSIPPRRQTSHGSPGTSRKPKANVLTVRLPPLHGSTSPKILISSPKSRRLPRERST